MRIIVLGAGGHARVIVEALRSRGHTVQGFADRDVSRRGLVIDGVPVIGSDQELERKTLGSVVANGLGNRPSQTDSGLSLRRELFERFVTAGLRFPPVVHATATLASGLDLPPGVQVMAGVIVQPGARIGQNAILNTRAVIEHDCCIGQHTHIAPGALLCGGVVVGEQTHIGAGAIILGGVSIGRRAVVAAGAVVRRDVGEGAFAANVQV